MDTFFTLGAWCVAGLVLDLVAIGIAGCVRIFLYNIFGVRYEGFAMKMYGLSGGGDLVLAAIIWPIWVPIIFFLSLIPEGGDWEDTW